MKKVQKKCWGFNRRIRLSERSVSFPILLGDTPKPHFPPIHSFSFPTKKKVALLPLAIANCNF